MNNEEKILSTLDTLVVAVGTLITNVNELTVKVDELEVKVNELTANQIKMEAKQDRMEAKQDRMEAKQDQMNAELKDIRHHVILIEEDNKRSHGALHDGYKQLYDIMSEEVRPDIASIKSRYEKHDMRILHLEKDRKTS